MTHTKMDAFVPSGVTEIPQCTSSARQVGNLQAYYASLKVAGWENSEKGLELQNGNQLDDVLVNLNELECFGSVKILLYTVWYI